METDFHRKARYWTSASLLVLMMLSDTYSTAWPTCVAYTRTLSLR